MKQDRQIDEHCLIGREREQKKKESLAKMLPIKEM
jgi:hypothetical protein